VRALGVSWHAYDKFMQKYVKKSGDENLSKVPRDLDLKPYREERDDTLLVRMAAAVDKTPASKARERGFSGGSSEQAVLIGLPRHRRFPQ